MTSSPVFISHDELGDLLCDVLAKGSSCRFQSKGHSMSPFVEDGDIVTVSPLAGSRMGFGSVVVFTCPRTGKVMVHRIVGTKGKHYLTRGDNAAEADSLVSKDKIAGVVSMVERQDTRVSLGFGMERVVIGVLSRMGMLPSAVRSWRWIRRMTRT